MTLLINQLTQSISTDYGKNWVVSDTILEDSISWILKNRPIFVSMGRVLLPVHDQASGRSFTYISDDTGRNWFPSVFIEPSEKLEENIDPEKPFSFKMKSPTLIPAGERKILCFMQPNTSSYLLKSISNDFGETWLNAEETIISSDSNEIEAIRLRDLNGNYVPNLVLVYNHKNKNGKYSLILALSDDIGETWNELIELEENEIPYSSISMLQTNDNKLHIIYSLNRRIRHLVLHDFVDV